MNFHTKAKDEVIKIKENRNTGMFWQFIFISTHVGRYPVEVQIHN